MVKRGFFNVADKDRTAFLVHWILQMRNQTHFCPTGFGGPINGCWICQW